MIGVDSGVSVFTRKFCFRKFVPHFCSRTFNLSVANKIFSLKCQNSVQLPLYFNQIYKNPVQKSSKITCLVNLL